MFARRRTKRSQCRDTRLAHFSVLPWHNYNNNSSKFTGNVKLEPWKNEHRGSRTEWIQPLQEEEELMFTGSQRLRANDLTAPWWKPSPVTGTAYSRCPAPLDYLNFITAGVMKPAAQFIPVTNFFTDSVVTVETLTHCRKHGQQNKHRPHCSRDWGETLPAPVLVFGGTRFRPCDILWLQEEQLLSRPAVGVLTPKWRNRLETVVVNLIVIFYFWQMNLILIVTGPGAFYGALWYISPQQTWPSLVLL